MAETRGSKIARVDELQGVKSRARKVEKRESTLDWMRDVAIV